MTERFFRERHLRREGDSFGDPGILRVSIQDENALESEPLQQRPANNAPSPQPSPKYLFSGQWAELIGGG